MFTGIIESLGEVKYITSERDNLHFWILAPFFKEIKIDQSIAHNGVCLTVVEMEASLYRVTAIDETLNRTNLGQVVLGDKVNLERCMQANGRFDGHIVQGHIDTTALVEKIENADGSWNFHFKLSSPHEGLIVEKGSISVNGVSLTVVNVGSDHFSVSIIPFTYEHTNFSEFSVGSKVNIEFDILGKYLRAMLKKEL